LSIDSRLEQALRGEPTTAAADDDAAVAEAEVTPTEEQIAAAVGKTAQQLRESAAERESVLADLADAVPQVAAAIAARSAYRNRDDLSIAAVREMVETGHDNSATHTYRKVGERLSVSADTSAPVTGTSEWSTVSHWHWLAATGHVRQIPKMLGPTLPYLFLSEAQIVHDLTEWSVLDGDGNITDEAAAMFAAVSGSANLTLFGTVLLHSQRHPTPQLPKQLVALNLQHAVRAIPRVTFSIGITDREVVSALMNNHRVYFQRRLRRATETRDAAVAVRELLDPGDDWPAFTMRTPVTVTSKVMAQLAADPSTSAVLDTEPAADAPDEVRVADTEKRQEVRKEVKRIAKSANVSSESADLLADIAASTTHTLAEICLRTSDVDVSRGDRASLALTFLQGRGAVVNYPTGNGEWRRITYVPGDVSGIEKGVEALRSIYRGRSLSQGRLLRPIESTHSASPQQDHQ
jgi:protein-disulfide isomerase-like protein with CxxC motif